MATETIIQLRWTPLVSVDAHGSYTAICDELGLAAMGSTEEEAKISLKRTVESFCNALRRKNLLSQALKESGISVQEFPLEHEPNEMVLDLTP